MYHRMNTADRKTVESKWAHKYAGLKYAKSRWQCVRGPIDATIATLLQAKWKPISPTHWIAPTGEHTINFNDEEGISHHRVLHMLREGLEADLWQHASTADRGSGLEDGLPHFGPASTVYDKFVKQGKHTMAKALELIIANRSWWGSRLLHEQIIKEEEALCRRCDQLV